jgi:phage-related protein
MKPLYFVGSALDDLREFPRIPRREIGYQLDRVQHGLDPSDWKPMKNIGAGVREIRVQHEGQFRVIYVAKFDDAVHVLHAFQKKTQKTRKQDLEIAKTRLRQIQE